MGYIDIYIVRFRVEYLYTYSLLSFRILSISCTFHFFGIFNRRQQLNGNRHRSPQTSLAFERSAGPPPPCFDRGPSPVNVNSEVS